MSYEPHVWVDREIISDQKMNHIENGIYDEETRATNAEALLGTGISDEELRARTAEALLAPQATTYTKTEVDNMFSTLSSGLDWKEAVATYADIATTYPNPEDGWTVNVKDTDYTYRYDGSDWVAISANAIPNATASVDGLMAKEDYSALHSLAPEKLGFGYGVCSTASGTVAKTVFVTDFVLKTNGTVVVKFANAVEANATLNVSSTGAKAIYYRGVALVADTIKAGDTVTFVYDGTYYHVTAIDIGGSISDMTGATSSTAGTHGLVPAPSAGDEDKVLKGDGTWGNASVDYEQLTYAQFMALTPTQQESGKYIVTDLNPYSNAYNIGYNGTLNVGQKLDALSADMTGASASSAGAHGLVPAPASGNQNKVLKGDGSWGMIGDIDEIKVVTALPSDASSHPTTFYLIKET